MDAMSHTGLTWGKKGAKVIIAIKCQGINLAKVLKVKKKVKITQLIIREN